MTRASQAVLASTPTHAITVGDAQYVYRELGEGDGTPLVALTHLGANLDSWDPLVVEPLAEDRRVILIGYRGVGASTGSARDSIEDAASDAIDVMHALGLSRVDLLGLSMGGMVAQAIVSHSPELVDRLVLLSSGPQGGPGLTAMTRVFVRGIARAAATLTEPTTLLFFTRTRGGKHAARAYQTRLKWRRLDRDRPVTTAALRAQLRAVKRWGSSESAATHTFAHPTLIAHGDTDLMVPPANVDLLAAKFPTAEVHLYADSGHGASSQNHEALTQAIREFLGR